MDLEAAYYVYVYIDPRNGEEFYIGKGSGDRKYAHLSHNDNSEKAVRIRAIRSQGFEPLIKVVANRLDEEQALLVEAALIWKSGDELTNKISGHFADKFRPQDSWHLELPRFDYTNGLYYVNVGDGGTRCWEDCRQYGYLSAGQGAKYSDQIRTLEKGDIVAAYLTGKGYVGIGRVIEKAVRENSFLINGKLLRNHKLRLSNISLNSNNENSEYMVRVDWIRSVDRDEAKWRAGKKLFSSRLIRASLANQAKTLEFLEQEFNIEFEDLLE